MAAAAVNVYDLGYTSNGIHMVYCTYAGATLSSGAQTNYLPFNNVVDFFPVPPNGYITEERTNDYVKEYTFAVAVTRIVTTTARKMQSSATKTWGDCASADISDNVFGMIAFGD